MHACRSCPESGRGALEASATADEGLRLRENCPAVWDGSEERYYMEGKRQYSPGAGGSWLSPKGISESVYEESGAQTRLRRVAVRIFTGNGSLRLRLL